MTHPLVKAYYEYMVDICTILGADRKKAEKDMWQVLQFEIQLANVSLCKIQFRYTEPVYMQFNFYQNIVYIKETVIDSCAWVQVLCTHIE